jgi:hypothetical protein
MAASNKDRLWQEIEHVKKEKEKVDAQLEGLEDEEARLLLQKRLTSLDEQLAGYARALGNIPAASGIV